MKVGDKEIKIVGMVRSKNSAQYLPRLLGQMSKLCDRILITDNESSDNTVEIINTYPKVMRFSTQGFNGGRDWRLMWKAAGDFNPDWVIGVDSDELFEEGQEENLLKLLSDSCPDIEAWSFPFFCCWDSEDTYNSEGWYKDVRVVRAFRYSSDKMPKDTVRHSTPAPDGLKKTEFCNFIRMKHFGYMTKEDRLKKYAYYCERDKDMLASGVANYEHFGPNAVPELRSWNDWKPQIKIQFGDGVAKLGGYTRYQDGFMSDYVFASDWLEHSSLLDYPAKLKLLYDSLNTGGLAEIILPNIRNLFMLVIKSDSWEERQDLFNRIYGGKLSGYDPVWLKGKLEQQGFINVQIKEEKEIITMVAEKPRGE